MEKERLMIMFNKIKKLLKKEPKYKTIFEASAVKIYDPSEQDIYEAKASYENLKAFLPQDVNFEKSYDVLGISFSAYVSSRANKNGQMISGKSAKELAASFLRRPINKDHNRKDTIGVITNYGFSEFGTERPLSETEVDELIAKEEPFNVNLGGLLWKVCDPDYIEDLVAVNNSDFSSRKFASSWEVSFDSFEIAEGSKNLSEARIINSNEEIEEIYESLAHFNGNGVNPKTNLPIYLLIGGDPDSLLGLGVGITKSPAAEVGPLYTSANLDKMQIMAEDNHPEDCECEDCLEDREEKNDEHDSDDDDSETHYKGKDNPLIDNAFAKVTCGGCNNAFNYTLVKEISMGMVECPNCKKHIDQSGKVYNDQNDETKFGPTHSNIVETAFNQNLELVALDTNSNKLDKNNNKIHENIELNKNNSSSRENECVDIITASTFQADSNKNKTYMKLTDIKQITDESLTKGEVTAGVIAEFLTTELDRLGKEWSEKQKLEKEALANAENSASTLAEKLAEVEAELRRLNDEAVAREKAEIFNTRLEGLATDYDFDDEEKTIVAERIKDLDSEGFEKYVKELAVFAKSKMKKQGEKDKEDEKLGDEVSDLKKKEAKAAEAFASLKHDGDSIPNTGSEGQDDLKARWAKSFKVTVTK